MASDILLRPTSATSLFSPANSTIDLEAIQGDVLLGLQKKWQLFVFFKIVDVPRFKHVLRCDIGRRITSSAEVQMRTLLLEEIKAAGNRDVLPLVGVNIAFTEAGITKLMPGADLGDPSFKAGQLSQAKALGDPVDAAGKPTTWSAPFLAGAIEGVFLLAAGTEVDVRATWALLDGLLGTTIEVVESQIGLVRPGAAAGHEHFGFQDGISQPCVKGLTSPLPGQQVVSPGVFVCGYPGEGKPAPARPAWVKDGAFMVFRLLEQKVPEFNDFLNTAAPTLGGGGIDPVLLGARMVGRWKSGAPVETTPLQDDTTVAADPTRNNDFDYSDDTGERRCPYAAHIRKTNPRSDIPEQALTSHRIIRAGIPFGPELDAAEILAKTTQQSRGLAFVCYQASIPNGFEFLQISWANNPDFVSPIAGPKHHPDGTVVHTGLDPIIGQAGTGARVMDEPVPNYPIGGIRSSLNLPNPFIVPRGGAYFFAPSIPSLMTELSE